MVVCRLDSYSTVDLVLFGFIASLRREIFFGLQRELVEPVSAKHSFLNKLVVKAFAVLVLIKKKRRKNSPCLVGVITDNLVWRHHHTRSSNCVPYSPFFAVFNFQGHRYKLVQQQHLLSFMLALQTSVATTHYRCHNFVTLETR